MGMSIGFSVGPVRFSKSLSPRRQSSGRRSSTPSEPLGVGGFLTVLAVLTVTLIFVVSLPESVDPFAATVVVGAIGLVAIGIWAIASVIRDERAMSVRHNSPVSTCRTCGEDAPYGCTNSKCPA